MGTPGDTAEPGRDRSGSLSGGPVARAILAASALLLVLGAIYGVAASETSERTDVWGGPRNPGVESGYCSRNYRLLPMRSPRPPDFIRFNGQTYIRGKREVRPPRRLMDTRYWRSGWKLKRAGKRLYLATVGESRVLPYTRGECS